MKLAIYQGAPTDGDEAGAFARIERCLAAAAAMDSETVVFPELFLPGYNRPDLHPIRAQAQGGAWETRLAELCRAADCGLVIGWAERDGEAVYNAASCHDRTGRKLAHYRKVQLFGPMEQSVFVAGDEYCLFDLGGRRAALLICYDVEFAHHVRALAEQGAEVILVPTANPAGFENVSDLLVPARAMEMAVTVAYANYHGAEAGLAFGGGSVIAGPDGNILAKAGTGEALLIVDLAAASAVAADLLSTQRQDKRDLP
ncbi:carbon-nitrogen hydrolase family protein [Antarctobacter heliothermus]|uniref:Predicted amidohydrolase n=1 Tax=Antarctobacter heliothermus TaxID=74033 RepID=A0A239EQS7_9RHOB|nr:carbon-nitrogen hydrolase family protein [Antarctobacter heliothermus]SNS46997.1 Predicted amidohydrolase [Antarctobacter heliothermus]